MPETWFTADTHFGHKNIIFLTRRPFKSLYDMDNTLIENWNSKVGKHDFVIHLGDFAYRNAEAFQNYASRLHGHIVFIQGNHDNQLNSIIHSLVVTTQEGDDIYCVHDPKDFSSAYTINLVGHVHGNWVIKKFYGTTIINVGVDMWNFAPVNINQIMEMKIDFEKEWTKKFRKKFHKKR